MARSDNFRSQHQDLKQLVGQIVPLLNSAQLGKDAGEARNLLSKLAGKISVHLSMEDKVLYPTMLAHSDASIKSTAQRFMTEMGGIAKAFDGYVKKWPTSAAIQSNPDEFIKETKGIADALAKRMQKEEAELYALYDKTSA